VFESLHVHHPKKALHLRKRRGRAFVHSALCRIRVGGPPTKGNTLSTRGITVGVLSLVAAGAIGGAFAVALGQGSTSKPTELRQVVQTTTTTPTVATTTPVRTTTTTTPKVTTTTRKASTAPKVQAVAPDPTPVETTPQPVTTTPTSTTPQTPPAVKPAPGRLVTETCGGSGCPATK
jgi:hypothetical protein